MRPKFFLYCLFSRPSLLLRGPSYPKKSKTSDFIVTVGVSKWVHPTGIFLLDTCRMVSGTHISWGHRFSMSIAIGKWLNKNSQRWYFAWENLQEVFVIFVVVSCSSFIVVLHLLLFLWCCFYISGLIHATGTPPWLLRPVKASTSSELYPDYFWLPFLFHLPRALRFWVGIFYPQAFFTLRSFPTFLAQPAFIKASLGAGSYSLKFAGLHTDPQNTDPAHLFVWFTVIHNLHIQNDSVLNSTIYYHELLVVKV